MSKDDRPDVGLCVIIGVVGIRWCDSDQVPADGQGCGRFSTGIKVSASIGWFAARPSGTEDICEIYVESFRSREHLQRILQEAQGMVDAVIGSK